MSKHIEKLSRFWDDLQPATIFFVQTFPGLVKTFSSLNHASFTWMLLYSKEV